jgi:hypothetical protein
MLDKSKFKFSETFNNSSGKTSGSGFVGVITGLLTVVAFAVAMVGWWMGKPNILEVFDKILQMGLLSTALLGIRKVSGVLSNGRGKNELGISGEDDKIIDKQAG